VWETEGNTTLDSSMMIQIELALGVERQGEKSKLKGDDRLMCDAIALWTQGKISYSEMQKRVRKCKDCQEFLKKTNGYTITPTKV